MHSEVDGNRTRNHGSRRWPDVASGPAGVLLIPVGSCEQHGPHLPLDTDTRIATAVARGVAARHADVWVGPPVGLGASGEHQSFPGTLSIGTAALMSTLVELGRSAFPAPPGAGPYAALVFVNGHGGNVDAVRSACRDLRAEGRPVTAWAVWVPGGDAHAGRTETSLLLAIAPETVGSLRPTGNVAPLRELIGAIGSAGVESVSPSGVLGDAAGASAPEGRRLLSDLVTGLDAVVRARRNGP